MGEMNGHWNPYCAFNQNGSSRGAAHSTAAFRKAFARIYLIMHGGPAVNARLRALKLPLVRAPIPANPLVQVVWNPQGYGSPDLPGNSAQAYYPGDKYVDMVGDDLYDIRGKAEWPAAERLYRAHPSKPFAFPEWGLWGIDDPAFVQQMATFVQDAPADEADRVLQRKAGLDLRPCVEAAIARRLQAVHRAARLELVEALLSRIGRELARVDAVFLQHLRVLFVVDLVRQLGEGLLHVLALALLLQLVDDEALVDMHPSSVHP